MFGAICHGDRRWKIMYEPFSVYPVSLHCYEDFTDSHHYDRDFIHQNDKNMEHPMNLSGFYMIFTK